MALNDDNYVACCVSFEYTNPRMMHADFRWSSETVAIDWAAHGMGVLEVARADDGQWQPIRHSPFNRRISAQTPLKITGRSGPYLVGHVS